MFGRQGTLASSTGASGSNLIEFRAGRMNMIGKMVHPDTRKGLLYLTQSEDGLMHFCWKDRTSGKVEENLIVFPDDFEFKRVEQCKTGRVYVLKFKTSSRRMFFWMQEPKVDKDEEYCRRVNELMNNPPSAQRAGNDSGDLQYMLNNMSQQQLMQLFGGVGQMGGLSSLLGSMNRTGDHSSSRTAAAAATTTPSSQRNAAASSSSSSLTPENNPASAIPRTPSAPKGKGASKSTIAAAATASPGSGGGGGNGGTSSSSVAAAAASATAGKKSSNSNPFSTTDLQSYLSNLSPEAGSGRSLNIDLSTALAGSDAINQLIADPNVAKTLSVHLPESDESDEAKKQQIKETIASPQFQQALSLFSNALQSAQLGPVVSQFELTPDAVAAAYLGSLEKFVEALENALPAGATMAASKDAAKKDDAAASAASAEKKPAKESGDKKQ